MFSTWTLMAIAVMFFLVVYSFLLYLKCVATNENLEKEQRKSAWLTEQLKLTMQRADMAREYTGVPQLYIEDTLEGHRLRLLNLRSDIPVYSQMLSVPRPVIPSHVEIKEMSHSELLDHKIKGIR